MAQSDGESRFDEMPTIFYRLMIYSYAALLVLLAVAVATPFAQIVEILKAGNAHDLITWPGVAPNAIFTVVGMIISGLDVQYRRQEKS